MWSFKKKPISTNKIIYANGSLLISIYDDKRHLHESMANKGILHERDGYFIRKEVDGKEFDIIHCIRDEKVLGHEMFHALGLIGDEE